MTLDRADTLLAATAAISVAAVGGALVSQHVYDIMPCPWCVLQRLIFLLIALSAVLGLAAQRLGAALALALAGCGIVTALWQHFVAAASASCNLTFADRLMSATTLDRLLPEVFAAYASCADAKVSILGLPYEFFSLGLFVLMAAAMIVVLRRGR